MPFLRFFIPCLKRMACSIKETFTYPLITAPLTVGFGGSVGLLGPAIGSASAISSNLSTLTCISIEKHEVYLLAVRQQVPLLRFLSLPLPPLFLPSKYLVWILTFASLLPST